jgi:hypothetical protein
MVFYYFAMFALFPDTQLHFPHTFPIRKRVLIPQQRKERIRMTRPTILFVVMVFLGAFLEFGYPGSAHSEDSYMRSYEQCQGACSQRTFECKGDCWVTYRPKDEKDSSWFERLSCYAECNAEYPACLTDCTRICGESPSVGPGDTAMVLLCAKMCMKRDNTHDLCVDQCGQVY